MVRQSTGCDSDTVTIAVIAGQAGKDLEGI
jgi:hypothetical protein